MTRPVKLSLCVPTYNFGQFIEEALRSALEQPGAAEIEMVVVDGASTDDTPDIVARLQREFAQINYVRLPAKGGIDRDMAKSIELASGEYCWLFSSDDVMRPGALALALNQIKDGHDIVLCKHMECTVEMKVLYEYPCLDMASEAVFDLGDPAARREYFSLALNSEPFFSFMGGIIVKKSTWDSVPLNEAFVGSCWAHVARLFEIMRRGLTLKYAGKPYINRRGGNDSFSDRGLVNRFAIGIDGYHRLADTFFGHNSVEAFHIRRAIRNEFPLTRFLQAKQRCDESPKLESKARLDALLRKVYCDWSFGNLRNRILYTVYSARSGAS
jgi:abequosyltransferase